MSHTTHVCTYDAQHGSRRGGGGGGGQKGVWIPSLLRIVLHLGGEKDEEKRSKERRERERGEGRKFVARFRGISEMALRKQISIDLSRPPGGIPGMILRDDEILTGFSGRSTPG